MSEVTLQSKRKMLEAFLKSMIEELESMSWYSQSGVFEPLESDGWAGFRMTVRGPSYVRFDLVRDLERVLTYTADWFSGEDVLENRRWGKKYVYLNATVYAAIKIGGFIHNFFPASEHPENRMMPSYNTIFSVSVGENGIHWGDFEIARDVPMNRHYNAFTIRMGRDYNTDELVYAAEFIIAAN